jgi:hypothetical protein
MTDALGVCTSSPGLSTLTNCWDAPDGKVCIFFYTPGNEGKPHLWISATTDFDLGRLFLQNGATARVRYADMGTFDGTPLPTPSTCPTLQNVRICGGNCGGCGQDETCHGRAPLHPYGFCIPSPAEPCKLGNPMCSNPNHACFSFKVEPEAQAMADGYSFCVPKVACPELLSNYPGGGTCTGM